MKNGWTYCSWKADVNGVKTVKCPYRYYIYSIPMEILELCILYAYTEKRVGLIYFGKTYYNSTSVYIIKNIKDREYFVI